MKINYLYEAGVFGTYKNVTRQSNIANVKKELTREATLHILENKCDELAELYLDMLNEVNSKINEISSKYSYKFQSYGGVKEKTSNILELSNFVVNTYFNNVAGVKFGVKPLSSPYVAKYAIDQMLKEKMLIIPGFKMKCAKFFSRFLSDKFLLRITYRIQKKKVN